MKFDRIADISAVQFCAAGTYLQSGTRRDTTRLQDHKNTSGLTQRSPFTSR